MSNSSPNSSAKKFVLIVVAALACIIAGFLAVRAYRSDHIKLPAAVNINTGNQPIIGSATAPIHITAFEDLKCINCKLFSQMLLPKILNKYVNSGQANYRMITVDILPQSTPAANAALCLKAQKPSYFFDFVDYVYANQPSEAVNWATPQNLLQMASHAIPSANFEALSTCMINNSHAKQIKANMTIAKKALGGMVATPSVYINGIHVMPLTMKQVDRIVKQIQSK